MDGTKLINDIGFKPKINVSSSVRKMINELQTRNMDNVIELNNPIYYNIRWVKHLYELKPLISRTRGLL